MARKVEVTEYQPDWKAFCQSEVHRLSLVLDQEQVHFHHIGSTAVPGLAAKPIIDLLAEVPDLSWIDRRSPLIESKLGYIARGENGIAGRRYFFYETGDGTRLFHLHAYPVNHPEIERHLAFRDYLIAHPNTARSYGTLKKKLADKHPDDIDSYISGKDEFVKEAERAALKWKKGCP
ncbi:GrpB family protein [Falsibacillus albus]|uniref:GrpB family protein n=1 Tax=Falsibacillus albus TaxID=2478915 RepID=A0A3L7JJM5_9BACI|nr:GrpB family protein [Falsibacillus albus]RLQ90644.1 GrpB family protein [Falsibacillus albus]